MKGGAHLQHRCTINFKKKKKRHYGTHLCIYACVDKYTPIPHKNRQIEKSIGNTVHAHTAHIQRILSGRHLTAVLNHYVSGWDGRSVIVPVVWLIWLSQPKPLYYFKTHIHTRAHMHTHTLSQNTSAFLCLLSRSQLSPYSRKILKNNTQLHIFHLFLSANCPGAQT